MDKYDLTMEELMGSSEGLKKIRKGTIVKGEVLSSNLDEVIVNIHYFCDGVLSKDETLKGDTSFYKEGDVIDVFVMDLDDGNGNVLLSHKRASYKKDVEDIKVFLSNGTRIKVLVKEILEQGIIAFYNSVRGFIPKSRILLKDNLNDLIDKEIEAIVIEVDLDKNRVIFSCKEIEQESINKIRTSFMSKLSIGDKFSGIVKNIKDFGVFVDIGGVQGLVHKSEISHKRNFNIDDIVKSGDKVEVCIIGLDKDKERISLSMKSLQEDPFFKSKNEFMIGNNYDVKVLKITNSGVIVGLDENLTGFIHISEFPDDIGSLNKAFNEGDLIKARLILIDEKAKRISLSYNKANEEYGNIEYKQENVGNETIGDKWRDILSRFK